MRDKINRAIKEAMLAKDTLRVSTLRLMSAAIKDRDIAKRTEEGADSLDEGEILTLLARMLKQREESAATYEQAGRTELAERERAEQAIIREFMPKQLSPKQIEAAIQAAIEKTNATSIRDMGKVMAYLKTHHMGQMDFAIAGSKVKAALG